jgi:molecular chaperone DnaK (HSP70)
MQIDSSSSVILAIGGDDTLGGRDWDTKIVEYFIDQWVQSTGSSENPNDSVETIQDFYIKAEHAKQILTIIAKTDISLTHNIGRARVTLTRDKFEELTAGLLSNTIALTQKTIQEAIASQKISSQNDIQRILLVGGSSKMPQVMQALNKAFPNIEKQLFRPDESVALGAAVYGQKLQLGQQIIDKIDTATLEQIAKSMTTHSQNQGYTPAIAELNEILSL